MSKYNKIYCAVITSLTLATTATAYAEDQKQGLERITVTAQKRVQSIQEIPSSITALSGENLDEQTAIKYLLDGDCLGPNQVPMKKRVLDKVVQLVKRAHFASPYREVTFSELAQQVTQLANALHGLGVKPNPVTSLILPNFPETYVSLWAAETLGVANPINPMLEPEIMKEIMKSANTEVLIALGPVPGSDIWQKVLSIKEQIQGLKAVVSLFGKTALEPGQVPVYGFNELVKNGQAQKLNFAEPNSSGVAAYFHTGGTTGLPKLAKQSHLNQLANATQVNLISPLSQGDTLLVGLPIFHVNAANATGLASVIKGATILMTGPAGFRTNKVIERLPDIIQHFDVNLMMAVPTVYSSIVEGIQQGRQSLRGCKMKIAISGAAPLSESLKHKFTELTGVDLIEGYGATETSAVSTLMPINDLATRQAVGLPLPGLDLKIAKVDSSGKLDRFCDLHEVGEIVVAGPNVFVGYLDVEHDKKSWIEDTSGKRYFRSGDLGFVDENGYLSLAGREKELIIRGGHNIDPKLIEDIACQHPAVSLAAAVGKPDAYAGEVPVLYVTLKQGQSCQAADLMNFLDIKVPERAAIPKDVTILDDMPTTAIGKIYKPTLNCDAVKQVVELSLEDIGAVTQVVVNPDPKMGLLAEVCVAGPQDRVIEQQIGNALADYTFAFQVSFTGAQAKRA